MMEDAKTIRWIWEQLVKAYASPKIARHDPIETLVLTILSQNTTDKNRDRAFSSLLDQFGSYDRVAAASANEIAEAIRIGGLQQQKARSLLAALRQIRATQGELDLEFLRALPAERALAWLLTIPGVGPKTAGIVLLFSFDMPVFPADTHIRRVMSRMGLVSKSGDPHPRLNALLPPDARLMQELHLLTIRLGREVCHPRNPGCPGCPLLERCVWARTHGSDHEDGITSAPIKRRRHR